MSMAPVNMAMLDANFKPRGSGQRRNNNEQQGLFGENYCERNREKVHEKPAKGSMFAIFELSKSDSNLSAKEKKIEKEKKKENERIEKEKKKEIERIEKEEKENRRKMVKEIKEEEKRIEKEKKREMEKKIDEDKKKLKDRINFQKMIAEKEMKHVEGKYRWQLNRNDWERAEAKERHGEYARMDRSQYYQGRREAHKRIKQVWRDKNERAKSERDNRLEELKSRLKLLDLTLSMAGEEVLRLHQLKVEDEVSKEQARERLRRSALAREAAPQPRQTAQSGEGEPTKKPALPVVFQEVNYSKGDNPFYTPGELKHQKMEEWDSDTCKEWIHDSLENCLGDLGREQLFVQLRNMPTFCGKRMFAAKEEEWEQWLGSYGLLIHDKLQKIAEMDM
ncbi:hypothetical protein EAE96_003557 [Botrytis aclada]|nr:hypothetical protein EAE96_003557 [Botrytis aclada]